MRPLMASIVAVALAAGVMSPLGAQSGPAAKAQSGPATKPVNTQPTLTPVQALPLTCAQAWGVAHKSYSEMLAIITTLAKVSLTNRNLTVPNRREAGLDAGKGIANDCKADPEALLFAVVDKHVRRVAAAQSQ